MAKIKSLGLMACSAVLAASLAGTGAILIANADEEKSVVSIDFTSYTRIMEVDEEFTFAAVVNYSDGSVGYDVEWASDNEDVIEIEDGTATAYDVGYAMITATADDYTASLWVDVLDEVVRVESISLSQTTLLMGEGWQTRIGYSILPTDATMQSVSWRSSNTSVATVSDGYVTTVGAGTAVITAMSEDGGKVATCEVEVVDNLVEATLTPANLTLKVGESKDFNLVLPEGVEASSYRWYSSEDSVASVDGNDDEIGTITSWYFGSTTIYAIAKVGETYYAASGSVLVTDDYFYLTGLEDDWSIYNTAEAAQEAGVLLTEDAETPGIYTITREIWANDGFQIIHYGMDSNWTTKITPACYYAAGSSDAYVANADGMFKVNSLGTYTVVLDLTQGYARVSVIMDEIPVTTVNLSVAEGSANSLQNLGDKITLNVATLPEDALYVSEDIELSVSENAAEYVSVAVDEEDHSKIIVTLIKESEELLNFSVTCKIDDATSTINLTIYEAGVEYVDVTEIAFDEENYVINVNNGGEPWAVEVSAAVNPDATVQGVVYSSEDEGVYIEYTEDGKVYVRASALGTFTVKATAVGNSAITAETTVYVYSENGFYLIGILEGETVNNWTSLEPSVTSLEGTAFADYTLPGEDKVYSEEFTFDAGDKFAVAFLGMNGNWDGVISSAYLDTEASDMDYLWKSGINVEIRERAKYTVTLDLSKAEPTLIVKYAGPADAKTVEYDLNLYIVNAGSSWNSSVSEEGNIIATIGHVHMVDGVAESITIDLENYDFSDMSSWPTIQFVMAKGTDGGYFVDATWYGSGSSVEVGGDAYGDTNGHFYNGGYGCQLWWVGSYTDNMTIEFSFTCNSDGTLATIVLNYTENA